MNLVEKHIIDRTDELDEITFKCKNLYNKVLYEVRQDFINNKVYPNKYDLFNKCKNAPDYKVLPSRVSRCVIRTLIGNWDSFFKAMKAWKKQPIKFNGRPKLPSYLPKNSRFTAIFIDGAILKLKLKKEGLIGLSSLKQKIKLQHKDSKLVEVQLIPYINGKYKVNIVYKKEEKEKLPDNQRYISIDLGVNNLMAVTSNTGLNPILVNGRPLKSLNQHFNKQKSFYSSELELKQKRKSSKKLEKLNFKRENKINDYLHKSSRWLIKYCVENKINTIIVGYNEMWKQSIKNGKKNNQNFVQIPFYKLIQFIEYKAKLEGIDVILTEESYTSKCSFLDNELMFNNKTFKGQRVKRGLFKTSSGKLINADINASYNIMRKVIDYSLIINQKVVPNSVFEDGIEGVSVHPIKINF